MVRLTELDGYHDPPVHGLIKVIGSVGSHDDKTIMPICKYKSGSQMKVFGVHVHV